MKQKLRYERIYNSNDAIKIDLLNGYTVIAFSGKLDGDKFTTTLLLKDNEFTTLREIEKDVIFTANFMTINPTVLKYVANMLDSGEIDKHIKSYAFEEECTSRGIEIVEKERLGDR